MLKRALVKPSESRHSIRVSSSAPTDVTVDYSCLILLLHISPSVTQRKSSKMVKVQLVSVNIHLSILGPEFSFPSLRKKSIAHTPSYFYISL